MKWLERSTGFGDISENHPSGSSDYESIITCVRANLTLIITVVLVAAIAITALFALLTWLRSRGKFMFLDGIARNRGAVVEPWSAFRRLGNSLFGFSFFLTILSLLVTVLIVAISGLIAWPNIGSGRFGASVVIALVVGGLLLVTVLLVFLVINLSLEDLVVPTMYLRNQAVTTAWSTVRSELLGEYLGTILLFFVVKFLLAVVTGMIAVLATMVTCCCAAALPYIGTVFLLPLYVFSRCYTLCFLEQFGTHWRFFVYDSSSARCSHCGQELYRTGIRFCPACGAPAAEPQSPRGDDR